MKTAWKSEIKDFKVTGVTIRKVDSAGGKNPLVDLAFQASAKGRLVAWNNITGSVLLPVSTVAAKGFGPSAVGNRDFHWVVHIMRGGKEVTRGMKPTPRKAAINNALTYLLAPALLDADTHPDRPFINEKEPAPKVARKRTRKPKVEQPVVSSDLDGLVEGLEAVGLNVITEIPKVDPEVALHNVQGAPSSLEMPEFLKR